MAPGIDGFRDANLYPLNGPNVAAARALMAGRTATAVLYTSTRPSATLRAQIIQQDLAAIGITVQVQQFARAEQIQREETLGAPFDMTTEGWLADYPDAEDFQHLLDGRTIAPDEQPERGVLQRRRVQRRHRRRRHPDGARPRVRARHPRRRHHARRRAVGPDRQRQRA